MGGYRGPQATGGGQRRTRPADRVERGCRSPCWVASPSWRWHRSSRWLLRTRANRNTSKFDAIIVGAGQAGPPLAGRLTAAGQTVAVIERKLVGGTCVNYGCIPTKTLVASAHAAHVARRGAEYGVGTGDVTVDMAKVKARKDKIMLDDRHGVESLARGDGRVHPDPRPRPLRGSAHHPRRRSGARGRPDLPQRRRPRRRARHPGARRTSTT